MTSIIVAPPSTQAVGQEPEEPGSLDRLREFALLQGRHGADARRHDLAALRNEALQQLDVLVIDLRRMGPGERARFTPTEERPARLLAAAATFGAFAAADIVAHASPPSFSVGMPSRPSRSNRRLRSRSRSSPRERACIIADGPSSSASTRTVK